MSEDSRSPIIKPVVDASGVAPGFEQIKKQARETSKQVDDEARKGGKGFEGMGEGAKKGADEVARQTGRMRAELQRLTAEAQAGGRSSPDYFKARIAQLGLPAEQLQPYLDGLKQAQQAQRATVDGLGVMTMSAKQTSAALRQVPAQFTDIVTSLASGQAPLTVLLQQGGQLKDVFGGAGAAAQALGGYIAGLVTPYTVLAAAAAAVAYGYATGSKEAQAYTAALVLSGNAAGTTAGQLTQMASAIGAASGATQGKAAEVLTQMAAAGAVGADNLQRFAQAAIELERAGGPAAKETAKAFAELAKSPLQASLRLTESLRYLTAATAEQISTLERQGRLTDAARVAQDAYFSAVEQRAPAIEQRLGTIERAWRDIKDAMKAVNDGVLEIGRPQTLSDLDAIIRIYQRLQEGVGGGLLGAWARQQELALQTERRALQEREQRDRQGAEAQAARVKQEEAGVRWMREGLQYLSDRAKLEQEVLRIRNEGVAAGKSEEEIAERLRAMVQQRYGGKGASGESESQRERERALQTQSRLLLELSGLTSTYTQDLKALDDARRRGVVSEERYGELVRALVAQQPIVRQNAQATARATEEEARAVERAQKAYEARLEAQAREVNSRDRTLDQLRLEYISLTAGKEVRQELEQLEMQRLALTYEQAAAVAGIEAGEKERYLRLAEQVRQEMALRRAILGVTAQADASRVNREAAQDAAREWQRAADQISQSLTDALLRGFESGKDIGRNLADTLRNMFRTMVLRPVVQAVLAPVSGLMASLLPGVAGASTVSGLAGIGNGLSLTSGLSALAGSIGNTAAFGADALGSWLVGNTSGALNSMGGGLMANAGAIGAAAPWVMGAVALASIVKSLDKSGTHHSGSVVGVDSAGLARTMYGDPSQILNNMDPGTDKALRALGMASAGGINALSTAFGGSGGYSSRLKFAADGVDPSIGSFGLQRNGQSVAGEFGWAVDYKKYGNDRQAAFEAYALDVARATRTALNAVALPDWARQQIGALGDDATIEQITGVVDAVVKFQTALSGMQRTVSQLGGVFGRVAGLGGDALKQLADFAGGADALTQQATSFAQNYYGRDEIAGIKAREIQALLQSAGITQDISTREQYRALVDGTDVGTESGRQRLAALLAANTDFAAVADYLAEMGGTLASVAAQAPATGALADLFSQPAEAQVQAIQDVGAGVDQTNGLLRELIEVIRTPLPSRYPEWEVSPR